MCLKDTLVGKKNDLAEQGALTQTQEKIKYFTLGRRGRQFRSAARMLGGYARRTRRAKAQLELSWLLLLKTIKMFLQIMSATK